MRGHRYRTLSTSAALITAVLGGAVAGCMPKHGDAVLFGTNTQFGIDASVDPSTTAPKVTVGYKRQEFVWMPLLANGEHSVLTEKNKKPFDETLKYVGKHGNDSDMYSVLASFGTKYDAQAAPADVRVGGGIAQYFATGLAARALAQAGGASLVNTQATTTVYSPDTLTDCLNNWYKTEANRPKLDAWVKKNSKAGGATELIYGAYGPDRSKVVSDLKIECT